MTKKLLGPLRIAVVGASGNVGTHISALLVNALSIYYQQNGSLQPSQLSGQYAKSFVQLEKLQGLFFENLQKFSLDSIKTLPIQLDLILNNSNYPSSSSYQFCNAVGFGFHPALKDQIPGLNSRIEIPKTDLSKLGVSIIENIYTCSPGYHLAISVVTEQALRNDAFCSQLGSIVHEQGQLALSMNGIPPYFLELFDDPTIKSINNLELSINRTESGANVLELLGGVNKLIGVVLTVADSTCQINTAEGFFHISKSAKARSECKLGSRKVNLEDSSLKAVSPNFFQNLGLCIGLGTSTELFLEYAILQKLAVNFILNPISALYPERIGDLINSQNIKALMLRLNDQFSFMVTNVLGLQGDILYKGELLIDRLVLSTSHIASTGQSVNARRRIEYINLRTFLDLVLFIANKKKLSSVHSQLEITIELFELFKKIYDSLELYAKDSSQPINEQLANISSKLHELAEKAKTIEVVKNPLLESSMTTRELVVLLSLSSKLSALTDAMNHLNSFSRCLDNYEKLCTMVRSLDATTDPAIQNKLLEMRGVFMTTNTQLNTLFYHQSIPRKDESTQNDREDDSSVKRAGLS